MQPDETFAGRPDMRNVVGVAGRGAPFVVEAQHQGAAGNGVESGLEAIETHLERSVLGGEFLFRPAADS